MAKKDKMCEVCQTLQHPDIVSTLGISQNTVDKANMLYLICAINYWMLHNGYEFGDEKDNNLPIQDAQLIDALSEIVEIRIAEGGDKEFMMDGRNRKMINFWRRTGRRGDPQGGFRR
jgi:hypothetical protein